MHTNASGSWAHYDLHTDHLGSTVLTTNQGNAVVSNERYFAYGRTRYGGIGVTDHRFTGQKRDGTGLQYYNARYYDPELGQFLSPDTVVPDPGNLFDYNRYMYTRGNPMKYNDPTGHCVFGLDTIVCIVAGAALAGGAAGGGWYAWNESKQEDGFNLRDDWKDAAVATGSGAVSGGLIATGGGFVVGLGMAANQVTDHFMDSLTGSNFSSEEHFIGSAVGAATSIIAPGAGQWISQQAANAGASSLVRQAAVTLGEGAASGVVEGVGDYVSGAMTDKGNFGRFAGDVGWGSTKSIYSRLTDVSPGSSKWQAFISVTGEIIAAGSREIWGTVPTHEQD